MQAKSCYTFVSPWILYTFVSPWIPAGELNFLQVDSISKKASWSSSQKERWWWEVNWKTWVVFARQTANITQPEIFFFCTWEWNESFGPHCDLQDKDLKKILLILKPLYWFAFIFFFLIYFKYWKVYIQLINMFSES